MRKIKPRVVNVKFPQSRELFLFARKVIIYENNIEDLEFISDIEIGRLIDYDYKYTHQWKFGKKNVHDIWELRNLANSLGVNIEFLAKIVLGEMDSEEAFQYYLKKRDGKFKLHEMERVGKNGNAKISLEYTADVDIDKCVNELDNILKKYKLS